MATFRKVHVQFWSDPFIQELTPEQKFFYLYLLTNDKTKQCGIYEITKRQICYDTGYNIDTVSKLIRYCIDTDKIMYNQETNELAIKNWNKYNGSSSPKVQSLVFQELKSVKDTVLIEYLYGMDNVEILNRNKNKKENKKENRIEADENLDEKKTDLEIYATQKKEEMIVLDMMKIWMKYNPSYLKEESNDFPACLQIAYKIAAAKKWNSQLVLDEKKNDTLNSWEKICKFIVSDTFYRKLALEMICKKFQSLMLSMDSKVKETYEALEKQPSDPTKVKIKL